MIGKYFQNMSERLQKLNNVLAKNPEIKIIDNSGSIEELKQEVSKAWLEITAKIV